MPDTTPAKMPDAETNSYLSLLIWLIGFLFFIWSLICVFTGRNITELPFTNPVGKYLGVWVPADIYTNPPSPAKPAGIRLFIDKDSMVFYINDNPFQKFNYTYDRERSYPGSAKLVGKLYTYNQDHKIVYNLTQNEEMTLAPHFDRGYFEMDSSNIGRVNFMKNDTNCIFDPWNNLLHGRLLNTYFIV
ncbi:hypothetical protein NO2_0709 [Candidatus Termititenax persephonae]|uniref:Uncharacterized protein n=1 Tax=Candidatus Termititenax persephonae TaxID=2218525 RepID=A0A388TG96_9BACT|nr:hypothetical protein NO2_0709 [Candidatus Termititenax persephonae]